MDKKKIILISVGIIVVGIGFLLFKVQRISTPIPVAPEEQPFTVPPAPHVSTETFTDINELKNKRPDLYNVLMLTASTTNKK